MYLTLRDRPSAGVEPSGTRSRVPRVVVTLGFVSLLTDVSSEAVAAILPLYLTTVVGLGVVGYGVIDGLQQGVSAVVRIAGGWASDRSDHPKWVAFLGYAISAASRLGLMVAGGAAVVAAVVSADRIGKGIRTAPRDAMIATSSPDDALGRSFGVHRTLDAVGAALGPLLAFCLLWAVPGGYLTVIGVSAAFALVGLALLGFLVPDLRPRATRSSPQLVRLGDLRSPRLTRLVAVAAALGVLTIGDGFVYLALLERGGFAATWFPLLVVGTNVAFLGLAVPFGRLADRIGRPRMLGLGHAALIAAYLCAAAPGDGWQGTALALLLLGAFYAATDGVLAAVASRAVPAASRATGIAAAQTATAVARLVASSGFGLLWFWLGPRTALLVVSVALLVVLPIALQHLVRLTEDEPAPEPAR